MNGTFRVALAAVAVVAVALGGLYLSIGHLPAVSAAPPDRHCYRRRRQLADRRRRGDDHLDGLRLRPGCQHRPR